ncbi:uncharacterized protein LOC101846385 [Aplysia californica]|uniref:Uncharacterized protein LOC101846385 n=1 Tax=Aplysia californica TaxID=6500 RepID=A0ABM0K6X0_APLCA|nr:uncharacterized protein LOC101846385 [Aplysia californica]
MTSAFTRVAPPLTASSSFDMTSRRGSNSDMTSRRGSNSDMTLRRGSNSSSLNGPGNLRLSQRSPRTMLSEGRPAARSPSPFSTPSTSTSALSSSLSLQTSPSRPFETLPNKIGPSKVNSINRNNATSSSPLHFSPSLNHGVSSSLSRNSDASSPTRSSYVRPSSPLTTGLRPHLQETTGLFKAEPVSVFSARSTGQPTSVLNPGRASPSSFSSASSYIRPETSSPVQSDFHIKRPSISISTPVTPSSSFSFSKVERDSASDEHQTEEFLDGIRARVAERRGSNSDWATARRGSYSDSSTRTPDFSSAGVTSPFSTASPSVETTGQYRNNDKPREQRTPIASHWSLDMTRSRSLDSPGTDRTAVTSITPDTNSRSRFEYTSPVRVGGLITHTGDGQVPTLTASRLGGFTNQPSAPHSGGGQDKTTSGISLQEDHKATHDRSRQARAESTLAASSRVYSAGGDRSEALNLNRRDPVYHSKSAFAFGSDDDNDSSSRHRLSSSAVSTSSPLTASEDKKTQASGRAGLDPHIRYIQPLDDSARLTRWRQKSVPVTRDSVDKSPSRHVTFQVTDECKTTPNNHKYKRGETTNSATLEKTSDQQRNNSYSSDEENDVFSPLLTVKKSLGNSPKDLRRHSSFDVFDKEKWIKPPSSSPQSKLDCPAGTSNSSSISSSSSTTQRRSSMPDPSSVSDFHANHQLKQALQSASDIHEKYTTGLFSPIERHPKMLRHSHYHRFLSDNVTKSPGSPKEEPRSLHVLTSSDHEKYGPREGGGGGGEGGGLSLSRRASSPFSSTTTSAATLAVQSSPKHQSSSFREADPPRNNGMAPTSVSFSTPTHRRGSELFPQRSIGYRHSLVPSSSIDRRASSPLVTDHRGADDVRTMAASTSIAVARAGSPVLSSAQKGVHTHEGKSYNYVDSCESQAELSRMLQASEDFQERRRIRARMRDLKQSMKNLSTGARRPSEPVLSVSASPPADQGYTPRLIGSSVFSAQHNSSTAGAGVGGAGSGGDYSDINSLTQLQKLLSETEDVVERHKIRTAIRKLRQVSETEQLKQSKGATDLKDRHSVDSPSLQLQPRQQQQQQQPVGVSRSSSTVHATSDVPTNTTSLSFGSSVTNNNIGDYSSSNNKYNNNNDNSSYNDSENKDGGRTLPISKPLESEQRRRKYSSEFLKNYKNKQRGGEPSLNKDQVEPSRPSSQILSPVSSLPTTAEGVRTSLNVSSPGLYKRNDLENNNNNTSGHNESNSDSRSLNSTSFSRGLVETKPSREVKEPPTLVVDKDDIKSPDNVTSVLDQVKAHLNSRRLGSFSADDKTSPGLTAFGHSPAATGDFSDSSSSQRLAHETTQPPSSAADKSDKSSVFRFPEPLSSSRTASEERHGGGRRDSERGSDRYREARRQILSSVDLSSDLSPRYAKEKSVSPEPSRSPVTLGSTGVKVADATVANSSSSPGKSTKNRSQAPESRIPVLQNRRGSVKSVEDSVPKNRSPGKNVFGEEQKSPDHSQNQVSGDTALVQKEDLAESENRSQDGRRNSTDDVSVTQVSTSRDQKPKSAKTSSFELSHFEKLERGLKPQVSKSAVSALTAKFSQISDEVTKEDDKSSSNTTGVRRSQSLHSKVRNALPRGEKSLSFCVVGREKRDIPTVSKEEEKELSEQKSDSKQGAILSEHRPVIRTPKFSSRDTLLSSNAKEKRTEAEQPKPEVREETSFSAKLNPDVQETRKDVDSKSGLTESPPPPSPRNESSEKSGLRRGRTLERSRTDSALPEKYRQNVKPSPLVKIDEHKSDVSETGRQGVRQRRVGVTAFVAQGDKQQHKEDAEEAVKIETFSEKEDSVNSVDLHGEPEKVENNISKAGIVLKTEIASEAGDKLGEVRSFKTISLEERHKRFSVPVRPISAALNPPSVPDTSPSSPQRRLSDINSRKPPATMEEAFSSLLDDLDTISGSEGNPSDLDLSDGEELLSLQVTSTDTKADTAVNDNGDGYGEGADDVTVKSGTQNGHVDVRLDSSLPEMNANCEATDSVKEDASYPSRLKVKITTDSKSDYPSSPGVDVTSSTSAGMTPSPDVWTIEDSGIGLGVDDALMSSSNRVSRVDTEYAKLKLGDLSMIATLGVGGFGRVELAVKD